jgi:pimeloyl-ACP methyl ester carboxylesterase
MRAVAVILKYMLYYKLTAALLLCAGTTQALQVQAQETTMASFAPVNGINLYYEVHGQTHKDRVPLVLIHGGGSTIESSFSHVLPVLARTREVIAIEEAGHGHTKATSRAFTFENTADDVAALLDILHIPRADILGFSNGGTSALQLAIRHPGKVRRLVLAASLYRRDGMMDGFFESMKTATVDMMPEALKEADRRVNPDPSHQQALFVQDSQRMLHFKDIPEEQIRAIHAPTLVLNGDQDAVKPEHAFQLAHTIPGARLAILPAIHGAYLGTVEAGPFDRPLVESTLSLITEFLDH